MACIPAGFQPWGFKSTELGFGDVECACILKKSGVCMYGVCVCVCVREILINQGGADFVRFQKANDDLGPLLEDFCCFCRVVFQKGLRTSVICIGNWVTAAVLKPQLH